MCNIFSDVGAQYWMFITVKSECWFTSGISGNNDKEGIFHRRLCFVQKMQVLCYNIRSFSSTRYIVWGNYLTLYLRELLGIFRIFQKLMFDIKRNNSALEGSLDGEGDFGAFLNCIFFCVIKMDMSRYLQISGSKWQCNLILIITAF